MLFGIVLFIFIIVCIFLCLLILIQSDKGGGISGAIGGGLGGATSLLGTQDTANILTRGTAIFGGAFLVLCIIMSAILSHSQVAVQKSVLQERAQKQQSYSPASVLGGQGLPIQGAAQSATPGAAPAMPMQGTASNSAVPAGAGATGGQKALPIVPPANANQSPAK